MRRALLSRRRFHARGYHYDKKAAPFEQEKERLLPRVYSAASAVGVGNSSGQLSSTVLKRRGGFAGPEPATTLNPLWATRCVVNNPLMHWR